MPTNREAMTARAISLLGSGYIYGATGWICTRARMEQQKKQYPEYASLIDRYGPRWLGKPCYDCAQLTRTVARAAGVALPSGSNSQWREKNVWKERGTIDTMPDEAGLFLFTMTGSKMSHTGVSIGGGEEIDARGHAYGVVRRRIAQTSFTHWARLNVAYDEETGEESKAPPVESRRLLRNGMAGDDVRAVQAKLITLGYPLEPYGADGHFGLITRAAVRLFQRNSALAVDGVVGPKTWAMLDSKTNA
ncbi:MAG: peptidoglycan-binding protein [Candidatus Ventricola sp.]